MKIGALLAHLEKLEAGLAADLRAAAERHSGEHDVYHQCHTFAVSADKRMQRLDSLRARYEGQANWTTAVGRGSDDVLEELRTVNLRLHETAVTWLMAEQAAKAARDEELLAVATDCQSEAQSQAKWVLTRIKTGAPQALVVG